MTSIRLSTQYRLGKKAKKEGIDYRMNPYRRDSEKYKEWLMGWNSFPSKHDISVIKKEAA
jgi:hypothetical protein